jgi:chemotaxis protein methyltransferase CheR
MIKLSDKEMSAMAEIIRRESGIDYSIEKKYLFETRLNRRMKELGIESYTEYLELVTAEGKDISELKYLINAATTNETSFFRNPEQIETLIGVILPEIVEEKRNKGNKGVKTIKIWSAASSSGEEIYTIAMAITEKFNLPAGWKLELFASDINETMLEKARQGFYSRHALRNTPDEYTEKYFTKTGDDYQLKLDRIPVVNFRRVNLTRQRSNPKLKEFDVVFCANVLIYFSMEARIKAIADISRAMSSQGYFFTGHAETLHNISKDFRLVNARGLPVYKKN